ncbi:MAG: type II secretion system GspH family protein [Nitrosomonas sp.]|nr:type II secretion system GspH family protein [Nitrosomonas sp.]
MPKISRGFTLVELMVVVAIMAVLASSAMPLQELIVKREKEQELRVALRQIRSAIDAYKQAVDDGRIEIKEDESGYPPKLDDLYMGVADIKSTEKKYIYFLRRLPRDPTFKDMDVAGIETTSAADTWGKRSYESAPENPQEGKDVFDIYSLSEATALNGSLYKDW